MHRTITTWTLSILVTILAALVILLMLSRQWNHETRVAETRTELLNAAGLIRIASSSGNDSVSYDPIHRLLLTTTSGGTRTIATTLNSTAVITSGGWTNPHGTLTLNDWCLHQDGQHIRHADTEVTPGECS